MTTEQLNNAVHVVQGADIERLARDVTETQMQLQGVQDEQSALKAKGDELSQMLAANHASLATNYRVESAAFKQMYNAECEFREVVSKHVCEHNRSISQGDFLVDMQNAVKSKLTFAYVIVAYLEARTSLRAGGRTIEDLLSVIVEGKGGRNCRLTESQRERVRAVVERYCPKFPGTECYLPPYPVMW